jgi:hypothetical protein
MPRSTRRRSRKHGREERDRSDSDEDPRPPRENGSVRRDSKGSEEHDKRLSSALTKPSNAEEASGSSAEGQKKRKSRGEQETANGDERWSSAGGEDERLQYRDSKKSRSSDGDAKGKSARKAKESDRSEEVGRRKSDKGTVLEERGAGEHRRAKEKERGVEVDEEKSKASKQVKEDSMDQQYKKDRSRDHEKGNGGSRHDASLSATTRNKEVKTRDLDSDKARSKCNGTDGTYLSASPS